MPGTTADLVSGVSTGVIDSETARAKINLALHILDRRADGYHTVDSLVVFADIADALTAEPHAGEGVTLAVDGDFADALERGTGPEDNLVTAAAEALAAAHPNRQIEGVRLHLVKRLPIAAGLGGGSADAAAALRLLNRFWGFGATTSRLAEIGVAVGADVPACVHQKPVRVGGIGDRLTPATGLPELPMVLVNPGVAVATRNVFRRLSPEGRSPMPALPNSFGSILEFVAWLRKTRNDLFEPAKAEAPLVNSAMRALASDPDCLIARMSGSGATVFGIFNTIAAAERAATRLRIDRVNWWVSVTRTGG